MQSTLLTLDNNNDLILFELTVNSLYSVENLPMQKFLYSFSDQMTTIHIQMFYIM